MTTFFLTLVTDLPTIHSSNFGARPVALPSWSGDGVYIHYWTHFYELNCSSEECSWSVMPGQASSTVIYNTAMYLPSDYNCDGT